MIETAQVEWQIVSTLGQEDIRITARTSNPNRSHIYSKFNRVGIFSGMDYFDKATEMHSGFFVVKD